MKVLKDAANAVCPYLKITGEILEGSTGIPVLYTKIWVGFCEGGSEWFPGSQQHGEGQGAQIIYSFYSKSMTNPLVMLNRSAIPETSKFSTVINEVVKRMKNNSTEVAKK